MVPGATTQNGCVLYLCAGVLGVYLAGSHDDGPARLGVAVVGLAIPHANDYMTGAISALVVYRCHFKSGETRSISR